MTDFMARRQGGFVLLGTAVLLVTSLLLSACGGTSSPGQLNDVPQSRNVSGSLKSAVEVAFSSYAANRGTPYQNVEFRTLSDDGTFATILVTAQFRSSASSDWQAMEASVEAKKVGDNWHIDPQDFRFSFTASEVAKQQATAAVTAVALTATASVRATEAEAASRSTATALAEYQIGYELTATSQAIARKCDQETPLPQSISNYAGMHREVVADVELKVPGEVTIAVPQPRTSDQVGKIVRLRLAVSSEQQIAIFFEPDRPTERSVFYTGTYALILTTPSGVQVARGHYPSDSEAFTSTPMECDGFYNLYIDHWWDPALGPKSYTVRVSVD